MDHTQFHWLTLKLWKYQNSEQKFILPIRPTMLLGKYEWSIIIGWPPFLEKKKAENNILSLFEAEKCVLKSYKETWIDKQNDDSSL